MKKNYTLEEIKKELFKEIEELEQKDPSWLNCRHCPFKGKCCIDNDIDIREDEWTLIESFLLANEAIKAQVKANFLQGSKCYFRTEKCCLIHDIRPTNCIYTPYQAIQTKYDHKLIYSLRNDVCDFETREVEYPELKEENYLISVPDSVHKYLFLNHWFFQYENQSEDCFKEEGYYRLKRFFEEHD